MAILMIAPIRYLNQFARQSHGSWLFAERKLVVDWTETRPSNPESRRRTGMDNEKFVRNVYQIAEDMDIPGFIALFTDDGTFTDESIDVTYRGADVAKPVEIYKTAFPDMHRELYHVYVTDDIVVVQLALQGTQLGPLSLPPGTLTPTGKRMDAPCCDVFELSEGLAHLMGSGHGR
jgi:ketosteroid isomerase-like protein